MCIMEFKFTIAETRVIFANELIFFIYIFKIGVRIRFNGALYLRIYGNTRVFAYRYLNYRLRNTSDKSFYLFFNIFITTHC